MRRFLAAALAALMLVYTPLVSATIKEPKGFENKLYHASYALYATSKEAQVENPKFLCTVTAFEKYQDGYLFLGAGHCTPANPELPSDMQFYVETDLNTTPYRVKLLKAAYNQPLDYAIYYLSNSEITVHEQWSETPQVVALGDENDLRIGDKTVDVNFTLGLNKFVSHGVVSSEVAESGPMAGFFGVDEFDSHGASGSAVVDEKSKKIVGIVIAGIDGTTTASWVEPISSIEVEISKMNLSELIKADTPSLTGGTFRQDILKD